MQEVVIVMEEQGMAGNLRFSTADLEALPSTLVDDEILDETPGVDTRAGPRVLQPARPRRKVRCGDSSRSWPHDLAGLRAKHPDLPWGGPYA